MHSPKVTEAKQIDDKTIAAVDRTIITNYNLLLNENIKDKRKFPLEKYLL